MRDILDEELDEAPKTAVRAWSMIGDMVWYVDGDGGEGVVRRA